MMDVVALALLGYNAVQDDDHEEDGDQDDN